MAVVAAVESSSEVPACELAYLSRTISPFAAAADLYRQPFASVVVVVGVVVVGVVVAAAAAAAVAVVVGGAFDSD